MTPISFKPVAPPSSQPTAFGLPAHGTLLKTTQSLCPVCRVRCAATVWKSPGTPEKVWLTRRCDEHGEFSACIASDARFYWLSMGARDGGCAEGGCCCSASGQGQGTLGRNAVVPSGTPFESLSTCLALIEIVETCNLACPTCYANSPVGTGSQLKAVPLDSIKARIDGVIQRKGKIEILQLSGGEPTLHPEFFSLLEWAQNHSGIDYILINTNGLRIAQDSDFAEQLRQVARRRKLQLYLQFDGPQEAGQRELRGADLRRLKQTVIQRAGEMDLPVTLAMTVTDANLAYLWDSVAVGLQSPHVQGITFQPVFQSGRSASRTDATTQPPPQKSVSPLNTADILLGLVAQSAGRIRLEDFTPLPCGDPNCATIGYLIRTPGGTHSISEFLDFKKLQGFLHDRVQYTLADLTQCGCESEPLGHLLKSLQLNAGMTFRMMVKPFMDAWTWDQDRIDRCCTHVIRPDGSLDSFCRYYGSPA